MKILERLIYNYTLSNRPFSGRLRSWVQQTGRFDLESRLLIGAVDRPHYVHCVLRGAQLAKRLGHKKVSVLELGVAGGNGLVCLEAIAKEVEELLDIEIDIYGFDTAEGLPDPKDYRDLKYQWKTGFFSMDLDALRARLSRSKLVIGDIKETAKTFYGDFDPAPVCAILHDMDFYSSTMDAFELFACDKKYLLPRFYCYFDDTIGSESEMYTDFVGQRAAINDFNDENEFKKIGVPYHLRVKNNSMIWAHKIWLYSDAEHPQFDTFVAEQDQQLALS